MKRRGSENDNIEKKLKVDFRFQNTIYMLHRVGHEERCYAFSHFPWWKFTARKMESENDDDLNMKTFI